MAVSLSDSTVRFMDMFGLDYPIVQASMDGPVSAPLVAAVSNAGALGSLPLTWRNPDEILPLMAQVHAQTSRSFFCNYVLSFVPRTLDLAIEGGMTSALFSWGMPETAIIDKLRAKSITIGVQVTGTGSAQQAADLGADFMVCQGHEAGGHVQAYQPLAKALDQALAVAGDIPVAASGGMATGEDLTRWLSAGAAACVYGSRFVATQESIAHPDYKQMLLDLGGDDTVYTVCLSNTWPEGTHRIFKNSTFQMWEAAGSPSPGNRPCEGEVIASMEDDGQLVEVHRYNNDTPIEAMSGTDVMGLGVYAGLGVDYITDLPSAGILVERLWSEHLAGAD